jgi:transcription-repair coupling factor (superfamily II helicase)
MTPDAIKRLAVLQEHSDLGQGFRIAMRDMEIRGAGNILGASQSGHVNQVGYEMYLSLLEQAVQEIKGERPAPRIDPEIRLRIEALIPENYVPDPQQRMNLYKRLSRASNNAEIEQVAQEMIDLYGRPPQEVSNLLQVMRIRLAMKEKMVLRLDYNEQDLVLAFHPETPVSPDILVSWARKEPRKVRLVPGDRLMYRIGQVGPRERISECFSVLEGLENSAASNSALSEAGDLYQTAEQ